nr:Rad52/Rad22 family DNA repair protein [uncultured Anaerotignum sp.]
MEQIRLLKPSEIECRIGTIGEKGLTLLLYKDARVDMKILDEVYGPLNWQRTHVMIGNHLYCKVSVWDEAKQQWISKMDVGTESYAEKEKGQASDSFKRACVSLGIGRELYKAPFIWVPAGKTNIQKKGERYITYDKFQVKEIHYNQEREMVGLLICNQEGKLIYEMQAEMTAIDVIQRELQRTGVALETVLQRYGLHSLEEAPEEVRQRIINSLKKTKSKGCAA